MVSCLWTKPQSYNIEVSEEKEHPSGDSKKISFMTTYLCVCTIPFIEEQQTFRSDPIIAFEQAESKKKMTIFQIKLRANVSC